MKIFTTKKNIHSNMQLEDANYGTLSGSFSNKQTCYFLTLREYSYCTLSLAN